jgi:hypothetical protein
MGGSFMAKQGGKFRSEIIKSILPKAENAAFLAGYSRFSGFSKVYQCFNINTSVPLLDWRWGKDMLNCI